MDNLSTKIINKILNDYRSSKDYEEIVTSYEYYNNKQEILYKKRLGIGEVKDFNPRTHEGCDCIF